MRWSLHGSDAHESSLPFDCFIAQGMGQDLIDQEDKRDGGSVGKEATVRKDGVDDAVGEEESHDQATWSCQCLKL